MKEAGFNMGKWYTNSTQLMHLISNMGNINDAHDINKDNICPPSKPNSKHVLGIGWDGATVRREVYLILEQNFMSP